MTGEKRQKFVHTIIQVGREDEGKKKLEMGSILFFLSCHLDIEKADEKVGASSQVSYDFPHTTMIQSGIPENKNGISLVDCRGSDSVIRR